MLPSGQNRQKKQSEGVRFWLIRHSKYSAMLSKVCPTDCFFGDFAHWVCCLSNKKLDLIKVDKAFPCSIYTKLLLMYMKFKNQVTLPSPLDEYWDLGV